MIIHEQGAVEQEHDYTHARIWWTNRWL